MQKENKDETIFENLESLRKTILKCIIALGVVLPFGFLLSSKILNFLTKYIIGKNNIQFNYFSPVEVFVLQIKIALLFSFVVSFPYIVKELWNFILPALYENEKKFIRSITFFSFVLFILGNLFGFFVIIPLIINFGLSFVNQNINALFSISTIMGLVLWICVVFGIMFQIPLVIKGLIKSGIVEYETIKSKRSFIIVFLLVLCAFLTPPDIISQIMLFLPTYLLFECGLLFSK